MSSGTRCENQQSFFGLPSPGLRGGAGTGPSEALTGPIHLAQFGFQSGDPEENSETQEAEQIHDHWLHLESSSQNLDCWFPVQTPLLAHIKVPLVISTNKTFRNKCPQTI